jgi:hypothetical protein
LSDSKEVAVRKVELVAGASARAIVPTDFDGVWRLSQAIAASGMAPNGIKTPEAIAVSIMHGLEIGLTPMASLQSIAVVNGRPSLWGDALPGLVRASGLCRYIKETIDGEGDARTARCETHREGEAESVVRTFSMADARKAGLAGKDIWAKYPDRMMQMRARAYCLRDVYADVLRGLSVVEEQRDAEEHARDEGPPPPPPPPPAIEHRAAETPPAPRPDTAAEPIAETAPVDLKVNTSETAEPEDLSQIPIESTAPPEDADFPLPEVFDEDSFLIALDAILGDAMTVEELDNAWDIGTTPSNGRATRRTQERAQELYSRHEQRILAAVTGETEPPPPPTDAPPFVPNKPIGDLEAHAQLVKDATKHGKFAAAKGENRAPPAAFQALHPEIGAAWIKGFDSVANK